VAVCTGDVSRELDDATPGSLVAVMTHSHALDFDIALNALRRTPVDFVGLIGSETKRARFLSLARRTEVPAALIERLTCPIGMPQIKGKEPAVIAASLAAQLLIVRSRSTPVGSTTPAEAYITVAAAINF